MKRVLVIGGTRFFGKRLVEGLLGRDYSVTLVNRGLTPDSFEQRVQRIRCERMSLAAHLPAGQGWDLVFDQVCYDAKAAQEACRVFRGRVGHYVFTSSQSVYGDGASLKEDAFIPSSHGVQAFVDKASDYAEAKRQAEKVFFDEASFPVTAVRFPIVLGRDDYTERLRFHVERILGGRAMGFPNLDARISFIHAADAAATLELLAEKPLAGPLNSASEAPIVLRDFVSLLEERLGRSAVVTDAAAEPSPYGLSKDWFMDISRLKKHGFVPRPIREWLPQLVSEIALDITQAASR